MKNQRKIWIPIAIAVAAALALLLVIVESAGGGLDVVATRSAIAFDNLLTAMPQAPQTDAATGAWTLTAPDGSARFLWTKGTGTDTPFTMAMQWDAQPFVDAGLDATLLGKGYTLQNGVLSVALATDNRTGDNQPESTHLESFRRIASGYPALLGYHMALDHYNLTLGDGNLFEWAGDLRINMVMKTPQDKDMVFVLNPEPLIAAGVDPEKVTGWVYAPVEVMRNNATVTVTKFLKPFQID